MSGIRGFGLAITCIGLGLFGSVQAHGDGRGEWRHHGGGGHYRVAPPVYVPPPVRVPVHGSVHGPRVGIVIGTPHYRPYWGPGWYGYDPFWRPYPPVMVSPPVVVTPPPPTVYIERPPEPAVPASPAAGYWYWCKNPQGWYPEVTDCPQGWESVTPRAVQ